MSKEQLKIKVGADPEYFFYSSQIGAYAYPWMIEGSKAAPYVVKDGAIQVDGLALELNIIPADTEEEWITRLNSVFGELQSRTRAHGRVDIVPTVTFSPYVMSDLEERIVELGCTPDFNAYTGEVNPRPNADKPDRKQLLRTAAGHIHIGWTDGVDISDPNHREDCFDVVKQLDYYLGIPSLLWDKDQERRKLYGKAGACRIKPYGVEYRVLSNQWFINDDLKRFVYQNTIKAVTDLHQGVNLFERNGNIAQQIINSGQRPDSGWAKLCYQSLPKEYLASK